MKTHRMFINKWLSLAVVIWTGGMHTALASDSGPGQQAITIPNITMTKVYDGTTRANVVQGKFKGIVPGDDVKVMAVGDFENAAVGTGKTITVVYSLQGTKAMNYVKPVNYIVGTGVITARPLTISDPALTLVKTYDGNNAAAVTPGALSGTVAGDEVTVNAVATYDDATAGRGKTITVVYSLGGADAANYIKPDDYVVSAGVIEASALSKINTDANSAKVARALPRVLLQGTEMSVSVYPNPLKANTDGVIRIHANQEPDFKDAVLSVYSLQGVLLYKSTDVKSTNIINLNTTTATLLGQVVMRDGSVQRFKVIVE